MPDWNRYAPARAEAAIDALRKLANTARNDYDVDPDKAVELFADIEQALADAKAEYAPRVPNMGDFARSPDGAAQRAIESAQNGVESPDSPPETSESSSKVRIEAINSRGIARFVQEIPDSDFPAWALHVANRMVDKAVGDDVGKGVELPETVGREKK